MRLSYLFIGCLLVGSLALAGCGDQGPLAPEGDAVLKADVENNLATEGFNDYDYIAYLRPYARTGYVRTRGDCKLTVYPDHIKYVINVRDLKGYATSAEFKVYKAGKRGWADVIAYLWGYPSHYGFRNGGPRRHSFQKTGYITKYNVKRYGYRTMDDILRALDQGRGSVCVYTRAALPAAPVRLAVQARPQIELKGVFVRRTRSF